MNTDAPWPTAEEAEARPAVPAKGFEKCPGRPTSSSRRAVSRPICIRNAGSIAVPSRLTRYLGPASNSQISYSGRLIRGRFETESRLRADDPGGALRQGVAPS